MLNKVMIDKMSLIAISSDKHIKEILGEDLADFLIGLELNKEYGNDYVIKLSNLLIDLKDVKHEWDTKGAGLLKLIFKKEGYLTFYILLKIEWSDDPPKYPPVEIRVKIQHESFNQKLFLSEAKEYLDSFVDIINSHDPQMKVLSTEIVESNRSCYKCDLYIEGKCRYARTLPVPVDEFSKDASIKSACKCEHYKVF